MKKYHKLVKFIQYLEDANTKWLGDDCESYVFYTTYSKIGCELISMIEELTDGPINTYRVLEKYDLRYGEIDFESFDYNNCNLELAFALLGVMVRKERFISGEILHMIRRGYVLKLIKAIERG